MHDSQATPAHELIELRRRRSALDSFAGDMSPMHLVSERGPISQSLATPHPLGFRSGCEELQSLLDEFGERMHEGAVSKFELRCWERKVIDLLQDEEIEPFMRPCEEEDITAAEHRLACLRIILAARAGMQVQID